jgi:C-terminal processing protease CtpA/Prc
VATFDFPGHKIYLRKGKEYNRRDLWARFGIAMRNVDGVIVFSSVDKNSLSEKAGFQAGDVLVKVGEFAATKGSLAPIWSALGGAGKLKVIIRRGSIEKSLLLDTDENAGGSYDH